MTELVTLAQAGAVLMASWAIVSGVGAWKREFIGKRKIDLAEQVLAKFFEVQDAIAYIRNPFSSNEEGSSRKKEASESPAETELLNRGYIVFERYQKREQVFSEFNILKYKFMASFGKETEKIFTDTSRALNSIFYSAQRLANHYWQRQGRVHMEPDEFQRHLDEMHRHEGIFWDTLSEEDEIRSKLRSVLDSLEAVTAPCFQEPMQTYNWLTKWRGCGG
jgi:hypothetical protein